MEDNVFGNANAYEGFMGRWSRRIAEEFVPWLGAKAGLDWLDVGAGSGILTEAILVRADPAQVVGVDPAPALIEFARQKALGQRARFEVGDASDWVLEPPGFDVAVAGLALNFMPSAQDGATTMSRAVRAGGLVAAYVWDYGDKMQVMRYFWDAAIEIDPAAAELDSGRRFAFCNPDGLRALFEAAGLVDVDTRPIDLKATFEHFDDYWLPFLGAQGSVSTYVRSLDDEGRDKLRQRLQNRLPIKGDGSIAMNIRAWAVKGRKNPQG